MLQKLHAQDYERFVARLEAHELGNLYIMGDIESFGFDGPVSLYALGDALGSEQEILHALLLTYSRNVIIDIDADVSRAAHIASIIHSLMKGVPNLNISGSETMMRALGPYFEDEGLAPKYFRFMSVTQDTLIEPTSCADEIKIKQLESDDEFIECLHLITSCGLGGQNPDDPKAVAQYLKSKHEGLRVGAYTYGLFYQNELVSTAAIGVKSSKAAMLNTVATRNDMRRRGFGQEVVYHACKETLKYVHKIGLYYSNPRAAQMYASLGFEIAGNYATIKRIDLIH